MKTMTWTALVALLLAVPLVLKNKKTQPDGLNKTDDGLSLADENLRYAIDDFLT